MEFRVLNDIRRRIGLWLLRGTQPPAIAEPHESLTDPPVTPLVTPTAAPSDIPADGFRGLRKGDHVKGGKVQPTAFEPPKNKNKDGYLESSVNWNDDDNAINVTFNDETNAAYGAARFHSSAIGNQRHIVRREGDLSAERKPVKGNPYHGNILFREVSPTAMKAILNWIAEYSEYFARPSKPPEP